MSAETEPCSNTKLIYTTSHAHAQEDCFATFLTAIGPEARKVFKTWNLTATEKKNIDAVIERYDNYCNPRKNVPFEHYRFNLRQEPGQSFDRYVTALRHIADKCAFDAITPDDILRDRIVFGIADNKVRERLLREPELDLKKTLETCRAAEMSQAQIKAVGNLNLVNAANVHVVKENEEEKPPTVPAKPLRYPCLDCSVDGAKVPCLAGQ